MINESMRERRERILCAGAADAARGLPAKPVFNGNVLGSQESMTYYDGYSYADPSFENPYRKDYSRG